MECIPCKRDIVHNNTLNTTSYQKANKGSFYFSSNNKALLKGTRNKKLGNQPMNLLLAQARAWNGENENCSLLITS